MQKILIILLSITSVTFGALYFKARQDLKKQAITNIQNNENVISKKSESGKPLKVKSNKAEPGKQKSSSEEVTKDSYVEKADIKSSQQPDNGSSVESTDKPGENPKSQGSFFKKMFDDPKMMEALKDQQKLVINTLYNDLFAELDFDEQEADEFKDLIVDSQMSAFENFRSPFGNKDEDSPKDSDYLSKDEKIKEFLGDRDFELYEEYNETLMQRMKIMQFKQQLALSNTTLSKEQETDLLNIMLEEGKDTQLPDFSKDPDNFEQKIKEISDSFFEKRAQSDKKILEKSRQILSTEQIEVFEKFQNTIRNAEEMGVKMFSESYNNKNQPED